MARGDLRGRPDRADLLGHQHETATVQGRVEPLYPTHLTVTGFYLLIIGSIQLNPVAAVIFCEVAGLVGGTQRVADRGHCLIEHNDSDTGVDCEDSAVPIVAQLRNSAAQAL